MQSNPSSACPVRGIYFATHFGNWYVNAPVADVCAYIDDLARRGTNHLMLWFDLSNHRSLESPAAQQLLDRLRRFAATARAAGMRVGLVRVANEAWQNSPPELRIDPSGGRGEIMLSDVCPSLPAARELIARTADEIFGLFEHLDFICVWPYDSGGCGCRQCQPWASTGFLVSGEIVARQFRRRFPQGHVILSTWFMQRQEWQGLREKIERGDIDWIDSLLVEWIPGPEQDLEDLLAGDAPRGLPVIGFPEISMEGMQPWGGCGANPRPTTFRQRWARVSQYLAGGFPYSEGIFEDVNKAIYAGLYQQPDRDVDDILRDYVATEFSPAIVADGVEMLKLMETTLPRTGLTVRNLDAADRIWQLALKIQHALSPAVAKHWRWQVLFMRARIDVLLKEQRPEAELQPVLAELHQLYHTDETTLLHLLLPPLPPHKFSPAQGNLAAGRPVTVSSGAGQALVDDLLLPFDPDTFWSSDVNDTTPWALIDLEKETPVANVQLQFRMSGPEHGHTFRGVPAWVSIEVSADGRAYKPVIERSVDVPMERRNYKQWFYSYPVGCVTRYVRLSFGPSKIGSVQLTEIRIYGNTGFVG